MTYSPQQIADLARAAREKPSTYDRYLAAVRDPATILALCAAVDRLTAFVKDIHEFRLDDETDYTDRSLPFNVCDYYHMEDLMKIPTTPLTATPTLTAPADHE